jgi:hypothetical protein
MNDEIRELLKNPALRLLEARAAQQLKRAGIKLGDDWGIPTPRLNPDGLFSPELLRRLAGG